MKTINVAIYCIAFKVLIFLFFEIFQPFYKMNFNFLHFSSRQLDGKT